jgi:hypothetical protein
MWREQGKDQMPQCFMGELSTRLWAAVGGFGREPERYFLRIP